MTSSKLKAKNSKPQAAGFTLLYSVLITGMLLTIGVAIFNIALKEVVLSSSARESQFAFYAADSGVECALFWDIQNSAFDPLGTPASSVDCAGSSWSVTPSGEPGDPGAPGVEDFGTSTFSLNPTVVPGAPCTDVWVGKHQNPRLTLVEVRGYNTCDASNPRRVERAIRARY